MLNLRLHSVKLAPLRQEADLITVTSQNEKTTLLGKTKQE
jgi:hypothetical protein